MISASASTPPPPVQSWNADLYEAHHSFVWQYGESLLELLQPQPGETILDLGCGTGQLTGAIAHTGATVMGLDADAAMLAQARQHCPDIAFIQADARNFRLESLVDAIFSNASLHWIPEADAVIRCIRTALKPGGRFVAELGGAGNIQMILDALYQSLQELGIERPETLNPWYFPSVGDYASRLEAHGFEVRYGTLFDRPTRLEGDDGMANWLRMFAEPFLKALLEERSQTRLISSVEGYLRPHLYRDGHWYADYRRLRLVAVVPQ